MKVMVLLKCVVRSWKAVTEALRNCKIYQSSLEQNRAVILQSDKCHSHHGARFTFQKGEIKEKCHAKDVGIFLINMF